MTREKKVKIFLVVIVVLYVFSTSYGLSRDDGAMGQAMDKVNEKVAAARRDIQEEMDKPFILRIFGSLFSMEGNSLEKLKKDLPKTLKSAMPAGLTRFSRTEPPSPIVCVGMRLADALLDLQASEIEVEQLFWSFDETLEEGYLQLGGTVLSAVQIESGGARLVIQYPHPWNGEDGLGTGDEQRNERVREARREADEARRGTRAHAVGDVPNTHDEAGGDSSESWRGQLELYDWLIEEDLEKVRAAADQGFPVAAWCDTPVLHVSELEDDGAGGDG